MRFTLPFCTAVLVTALSLLPYQLAQAQVVGFDVFTAPLTPGISIPAGSTYTIKWNPSPSPVGDISLVLLQGSSNTTLSLGPTIASGIDSTTGSYDWKVPASPSFPVYGLKLQLDSDSTVFQYSTYFSISGSNTAVSSPPTTAVHSTTTTVQVVQGSSQPTDTSSSTPSPSSSKAPLPTSRSTSSTTSLTASSTGSSSSTTQETGTQTSASENPFPTASSSSTVSNDSLSTGAKAGIAIGAVVGAGIFALLAYIAFLLRKRNTQSGPVRGSDKEGEEQVPELGPGLVPEMDGRGRVGELDITNADTSQKATRSEVAELG